MRSQCGRSARGSRGSAAACRALVTVLVLRRWGFAGATWDAVPSTTDFARRTDFGMVVCEVRLLARSLPDAVVRC